MSFVTQSYERVTHALSEYSQDRAEVRRRRVQIGESPAAVITPDPHFDDLSAIDIESLTGLGLGEAAAPSFGFRLVLPSKVLEQAINAGLAERQGTLIGVPLQAAEEFYQYKFEPGTCLSLTPTILNTNLGARWLVVDEVGELEEYFVARSGLFRSPHYVEVLLVRCSSHGGRPPRILAAGAGLTAPAVPTSVTQGYDDIAAAHAEFSNSLTVRKWSVQIGPSRAAVIAPAPRIDDLSARDINALSALGIGEPAAPSFGIRVTAPRVHFEAAVQAGLAERQSNATGQDLLEAEEFYQYKFIPGTCVSLTPGTHYTLMGARYIVEDERGSTEEYFLARAEVNRTAHYITLVLIRCSSHGGRPPATVVETFVDAIAAQLSLHAGSPETEVEIVVIAESAVLHLSNDPATTELGLESDSLPAVFALHAGSPSTTLDGEIVVVAQSAVLGLQAGVVLSAQPEPETDALPAVLGLYAGFPTTTLGLTVVVNAVTHVLRLQVDDPLAGPNPEVDVFSSAFALHAGSPTVDVDLSSEVDPSVLGLHAGSPLAGPDTPIEVNALSAVLGLAAGVTHGGPEISAMSAVLGLGAGSPTSQLDASHVVNCTPARLMLATGEPLAGPEPESNAMSAVLGLHAGIPSTAVGVPIVVEAQTSILSLRVENPDTELGLSIVVDSQASTTALNVDAAEAAPDIDVDAVASQFCLVAGAPMGMPEGVTMAEAMSSQVMLWAGSPTTEIGTAATAESSIFGLQTGSPTTTLGTPVTANAASAIVELQVDGPTAGAETIANALSAIFALHAGSPSTALGSPITADASSAILGIFAGAPTGAPEVIATFVWQDEDGNVWETEDGDPWSYLAATPEWTDEAGVPWEDGFGNIWEYR